MMALPDDSVLKEFEENEQAEPSAQKADGDRVVYKSRPLDIPDEPGNPILCDFGDAQFGQVEYVGEVMPDLYRAPEIVLGIPWNKKIDIWSVGLMVSHSLVAAVQLIPHFCQIWDLFEGKHMFNERLPNREASSAAHLARMIALLGPPPTRLLQRGTVSRGFFNEHCKCKA